MSAPPLSRQGPPGALGREVGVDARLAGVAGRGLRDAGGPLRWRRAWPAGPEAPGALLVEAVGADGRVVAAVVDGPDGASVRLHPEDERLPALPQWRARGARVHAHRLHRRAVLLQEATPDRSVLPGRGVLPGQPAGSSRPAGPTASGAAPGRRWVKLARPSATRSALQRAERVAGLLHGCPGAPRLAEVLDADPARGVLVLAPLPGHDLAGLLRRSDTSAAAARCAGEQVGDVLRALAAAPVGGCALPRHDVATEADVLLRWVASAIGHGAVRGSAAALLDALAQQAAAALLRLPQRPAVLAHRDLHDGQLLLHPDGVGLLDLDTAALADPALDLANLLAHLDLAAAQGHAAAAGAVAAGLTGLPVTPGRLVEPADPHLAGLRQAARLRLCAVHAFRPGATAVVPALLARCTG